MGRRGRGRQDIDLHLLKPAKFRPDPEWALPPADIDSVVHDEDPVGSSVRVDDIRVSNSSSSVAMAANKTGRMDWRKSF